VSLSPSLTSPLNPRAHPSLISRPSEDKDASEAVYKLFTDPKKIQITDPSKGPEYGDHIFS